MAKDNHIGIVYVLSNRAMPGLVKIGMTTRPELDARLKELYTTGVPVPFDVEYACEVKACNCAKLEKALHTAFEPNRLNVNREFFQIKKEQAIAILEIFNEKEITTEVSDEMNNDLNADDIASKSKATKTCIQICLLSFKIITFSIVYVCYFLTIKTSIIEIPSINRCRLKIC